MLEMPANKPKIAGSGASLVEYFETVLEAVGRRPEGSSSGDPATESTDGLLTEDAVDTGHQFGAHKVELSRPNGIGASDREHTVTLSRWASGGGDLLPDCLFPDLLDAGKWSDGRQRIGQAA
jgi:hypothetical protein